MSKLFLGSIDLSKINKKDIVTTDNDGKPFKNGAKYLNVSIWVNDEPDKYGNQLSIKSGKKDESYYIGNAKAYERSERPKEVSNQVTDNDLPF